MMRSGSDARLSVRYLPFVVAFCGIGLYMSVGIYAERTQQERAAVFFKDTLKTVGINEQPGSFETLRLAYAKTLAERSPLLSLAGTDPDALQYAVDDAEKTRSAFADIQKTSGHAALVTSGLYPISFLRAITAAEKARRVFIQSGTAEDNAVYDKARRDALTAYQKSLTQFRSAFIATVPPSMRTYTAGGVLVSREGVLQAVDALEVGSEKISAKDRERERCLSGHTDSCEAGDLAIPMLTMPPPVTPLSAVDRSTITAVRAFSAELGKPLAPAEPLVQLADSACNGSSTPAVFGFYTDDTKNHSSGYVQPTIAGDLRLVRAVEYPNEPFFSYFKNQGAQYVPNNPLTHYTCPGVGRDIATALWIREVRQFALSAKVSQYSGPYAEALRSTEHTFASAYITEEADAVAYMNLARSSVQGGAVPEDTKNRVISLLLEKLDNSTDFDHVVSLVVSIEQSNLRAVGHEVPLDLQAETLFYFRSAWFPFFMADNASVAQFQGPLLPPLQAQDVQSPFVYASSLLNKPQDRAQLEKDLTLYMTAHL